MKRFTFALAIAGSATSAMATPPPRTSETVIATVNGWRITDHRGQCSADTAFVGNILASVTYNYATNSVYFIVHNPAWESIQDGQTYSVSLHFSNGRTYDDAHALGQRNDGPDGRFTALFMHLVGDEFMGDFYASAAVEMRMADRRLGTLSLRGTREVATRLARCSNESFRRYPPDPFRTAPTPSTTDTGTNAPTPRFVEPARARANLNSYLSDADYPASAIRANEQGTTGYRLQVGPDGRVTECTITSSSCSAALDDATCRIMRSRARFTPARDNTGAPTTDTVSGRQRWVLPED